MLIEKESCIGCGACYNRCKLNAIEMQYDDAGFKYPVINLTKCNQCSECENVCPMLHVGQHKEIDICLSVVAHKEEKKESSSGGFFWILARNIISQGGYVAGAIWADDWKVKHIVSNKIEDVQRMRKSKYVQSDIGNVYSDIQKLLKSNKMVLFSGCPCQVAALKQFLGVEYVNLFTLDILCHGVPSPLLWSKHLRELTDKKICGIRFENVKPWGHKRGGDIYISAEEENIVHDDKYMYECINAISLRQSCYQCRYRNNYWSDITLGEVKIDNTYLNDEKCISICMPHTSQGMNSVISILEEFCAVGTINPRLVQNENMAFTNRINNLKIRNLFYRNIKTGVKEHYDIMLAVIWLKNYGSALTNYALYSVLSQMGYSVLMLNRNDGVPNYFLDLPRDCFAEFAWKYYNNSVIYLETEDNINDLFDCVIVGSEQIWNYTHIMLDKNGIDRYFLAFADDDKKKIAYATSFGSYETIPPRKYDERIARLLNRMNGVSVRERFGIDVCKRYGKDAVKVMDAVFLLDKSYYQNLINSIELSFEIPKVFAYIVEPSEKKLKFIHDYAKKLGTRPVIVRDADNTEHFTIWDKESYCESTTEHIIFREIKVEEWLACVQGSEYVITDSYHATCFSIIFEKRFLTFICRQKERFETFTEMPELAEHIVDIDVQENLEEFLEKEINYVEVNQYLEKEIEKSKLWLRNELNKNDKTS